MDDLIKFVLAFFYWRVLLCVGATAFAAILLRKNGDLATFSLQQFAMDIRYSASKADA